MNKVKNKKSCSVFKVALGILTFALLTALAAGGERKAVLRRRKAKEVAALD